MTALQDAITKAKSDGTFDQPILKKGDSGKEVKKLQSQLKDLGYYGGKTDGKFDKVTQLAVEIFQTDNHLKSTGVVKHNTYAALGNKPISITDAVNALAKKNDSSNHQSSSSSDHSSSNSSSSKSSAQSYTTVTVKSTAYTASCSGCSGVTALGINLKSHPNDKVIAVDPSVIPLGSKVYVPGYGYAIAGDTGGAINGHRIDVYFSSHSQAMSWGVRDIQVKVYK